MNADWLPIQCYFFQTRPTMMVPVLIARGRTDLLLFEEVDWMRALWWILTGENPPERALELTPMEVVKVVSFVERVSAPNPMPFL